MTQFTKDMIPTSIVTTEALAVWLSEVHSYLYPNALTLEARDQDGEELNSRVAEANKFYLTAPDIPHWQHISRLSVELKPEHQVVGRVWEHVTILGDKAVPSQMRAIT